MSAGNSENKVIFKSYQLLGASNMVRFASQILKIKPGRNDNGAAQSDMCVSGQCIRHLIRRVKKQNVSLANQVLVCIGTNDLNKKTPTTLSTFKVCLRTLIKAIRAKGTRYIVITTILPSPALVNRPQVKELMDLFNGEIRKLDVQPTIQIIDVYSFFTNPNGSVQKQFFERYYKRPYHQRHLQPKPDWLHLNNCGLRRLASWLEEVLPAVSTT